MLLRDCLRYIFTVKSWCRTYATTVLQTSLHATLSVLTFVSHTQAHKLQQTSETVWQTKWILERARDVSCSLSHPYRRNRYVSIFFIPPLSTWPVMCRVLYSIPIDRTRDVSCSLFHPYRQDPWCVVLFIPPLLIGSVMCRVLYSTSIDRNRGVSLARCPFNSRADKSSPRATRGYDESPERTVSPLCKTLKLYIYSLKRCAS